MMIQAEVSLYPLRTDEIGVAIESFNGVLKDAGLAVHEAAMSTKLSGDVDEVFAALGEAFKHVANDHQVVLVLKASNACPSDDTANGKNADVR